MIARNLLMLLAGLLVQQAQSKTIRSDESNSWHMLCEMKHKDEFVYDASVTAHGCRLNCVVLKETKTEGHGTFYGNADVFEHNLNDGIYCKPNHVCKSGNCTFEIEDGPIADQGQNNVDRKGIVIIEVIEARLPKKDQLTQTDGYVKISIKGPDGSRSVGKTLTKMDTANPVWNYTAKEEVSPKATIFFEIYDWDMMNENDYIGSVYIPIKRLLKENKNGKPITLTFPDGSLTITITWLGNHV